MGHRKRGMNESLPGLSLKMVCILYPFVEMDSRTCSIHICYCSIHLICLLELFQEFWPRIELRIIFLACCLIFEAFFAHCHWNQTWINMKKFMRWIQSSENVLKYFGNFKKFLRGLFWRGKNTMNEWMNQSMNQSGPVFPGLIENESYNSVIRTRNFVIRTRNFVIRTRNFVIRTRN